MKYRYPAAILMIASLSVSAGPPQNVIPMIDLEKGMCYIPQSELSVTEFGGSYTTFATVIVAQCPAAMEPQGNPATKYRAYMWDVRFRPDAAGSGPDGVIFKSKNYPDTPCVVRAGLFKYYITDEWKTSIAAAPGGTRYAITCWVDDEDEAEPEDLEALGVTGN